ncbi:MAG TPA: FAD-dependent oxidoreductase [Candidatus Dormibacteraeota bacterium]|nr:FAD-dependent oxidoreductase [Candidatus Dormibacteraeota bacterium]
MPAAVDADLVVIGAGPAGASTALFAARKGLRVVVLERAHFPKDKPCGEGLMPKGRAILAELGLEATAVASGAPSFRGIKFGLKGATPTTVAFPSDPFSGNGLGVRRLDFDSLLAEAMVAQPLIELCQDTPVRSVRIGAKENPSVVTSVGEIRSRSVAVADGLRSPIRHQLGWTRGPRPPHRFGVVSHWMADAPPDPWVRITIDRGMELYEGPVAGNRRLVALLCSKTRMGEFAGKLDQRYREIALELRPELQAAVQEGGTAAIGPFRYGTKTVARDGVFLVGDASGFTDPITGEGLASGMQQGKALATVLGEPDCERSYCRAHRKLPRDPRRVAALLLYLSASPVRVERGLRGLRRAPNAWSNVLGANFGYWGLSRVTPREWIALVTGW